MTDQRRRDVPEPGESPVPTGDRSTLAAHRAALRVLLGGIIACTLLALLALVPGPDRSGDSVVVLGDSITEFGQNHLRAQLGEHYQLTVDGVFGARTGDRLWSAASIAGGSPDQVVVNLGTNDVVVGTPLDRVRHDLDELLGHLEGVECVHVVTVSENLVSDGVALPRAGAALNEQIAEVVDSHPNASLVHWDRVQQAAALRREDPQALLADGIHPDGDGLTVLAEGYDDALSDCGRPWFLP